MKSCMFFSVIFLSSCLCIFASVVDPEKAILLGGGRTVRRSGQLEGQEEAVAEQKASQPPIISHLWRFGEKLIDDNDNLMKVVQQGNDAKSDVSKNKDDLNKVRDELKGEISIGNINPEEFGEILKRMSSSCDETLLTVKLCWEMRKAMMERMATVLRRLEAMLKQLGKPSLEWRSRVQQKRLSSVRDEVEALKVTLVKEKPILEGGVVQNMQAVVENALAVAMEMSQMLKLQRMIWEQMKLSLAIMEESLDEKALTYQSTDVPVSEIAQMDLYLKEDSSTVKSLTDMIKYIRMIVQETAGMLGE